MNVDIRDESLKKYITSWRKLLLLWQRALGAVSPKDRLLLKRIALLEMLDDVELAEDEPAIQEFQDELVQELQHGTDEDETKPVTLRSLLATKGHHVRAPYGSWGNAHAKIVAPCCISKTSPDDAGKSGLTYCVFMALRDTSLKEFDRDEDNTYFELWANGRDYEVWVDAKRCLCITPFDDEATMAKPHNKTKETQT